MEDRKLSVTLTGPAKIDGVREPAGKSVTVTTTLALQLAASGVINSDAVRDAVSDEVEPLKGEITKLKGDLSAMTARAETAEKAASDLETDLSTEKKARADAEAELATAQAELEKLTKPDTDPGKGDDAKPAKPTK
ncbi:MULTISPECIES: hypothetical protein [Brucella]|uniref:hypothetical protein n=1 Tax=Brucella TaxID=234 RepID=UPI00031877F7|nr:MULTISPECIES: hypothetical protein [Brucella]KEY05833.1 hypothetical protein IL59_0201250 [Brucella suis bv. 4 str. 40]QGA56496.1 hypothetical protein GHC20_05080 [Brucella sp. 2280]